MYTFHTGMAEGFPDKNAKNRIAKYKKNILKLFYLLENVELFLESLSFLMIFHKLYTLIMLKKLMI